MYRHKSLTVSKLPKSWTAGFASNLVRSAKGMRSFNSPIPASVMTPDKVETRVGTLEFFDGIPTKETAALLLENLDLNRGVDTFLNGMPAANMEAARRGHVALGQKKSNQVVIFD